MGLPGKESMSYILFSYVDKKKNQKKKVKLM